MIYKQKYPFLPHDIIASFNNTTVSATHTLD
jgi:hypothetical protein